MSTSDLLLLQEYVELQHVTPNQRRNVIRRAAALAQSLRDVDDFDVEMEPAKNDIWALRMANALCEPLHNVHKTLFETGHANALGQTTMMDYWPLSQCRVKTIIRTHNSRSGSRRRPAATPVRHGTRYLKRLRAATQATGYPVGRQRCALGLYLMIVMQLCLHCKVRSLCSP